jgi:hypothetical protein
VRNIKKVFRNIIVAIATCVAANSLQGCILGEGCAPSVDASHLFVDSDWVNKHLDENAFDFDCTGDAFPPPPGVKNGRVSVTIGLLVKQVYLSMGKPSLANIARIRADALQMAKEFAKSAIQMQNSGVKDVQDVICKETYMKAPDVVGACKVSENDQQGAPEVELPPGGGEPWPTPSPASIPILVPTSFESSE